MGEIGIINGKIVGYLVKFGGSEKGTFWRYIFYLDNNKIAIFYGSEQFYFSVGDKMEFYGEDCGDYFKVFTCKLLEKYVPPQKKILDWLKRG